MTSTFFDKEHEDSPTCKFMTLISLKKIKKGILMFSDWSQKGINSVLKNTSYNPLFGSKQISQQNQWNKLSDVHTCIQWKVKLHTVPKMTKPLSKRCMHVLLLVGNPMHSGFCLHPEIHHIYTLIAWQVVWPNCMIRHTT